MFFVRCSLFSWDYSVKLWFSGLRYRSSPDFKIGNTWTRRVRIFRMCLELLIKINFFKRNLLLGRQITLLGNLSVAPVISSFGYRFNQIRIPLDLSHSLTWWSIYLTVVYLKKNFFEESLRHKERLLTKIPILNSPFYNLTFSRKLQTNIKV